MRRQIMALVVGLTTLVILAFAIPVALLIRSSVVQNAERAAVLQANNVALTIRTNNNQAAIESYLKALAQNKDRRTSVRTPDGTLLGTAPPGAGRARRRQRSRPRTRQRTTGHHPAEKVANRPNYVRFPVAKSPSSPCGCPTACTSCRSTCRMLPCTAVKSDG